jgi:hypothetical protein
LSGSLDEPATPTIKQYGINGIITKANTPRIEYFTTFLMSCFSIISILSLVGLSLQSHCRQKIAANVQVLPKAGYFLMPSPELKINRITNDEEHIIDAA